MIFKFSLLQLVALPFIQRITSSLLSHDALVSFVSWFSSMKFYLVSTIIQFPNQLLGHPLCQS